MTSHATTDRSSSHQSTSGTGDDARSEGLLIKPTVSLLAAPSSVANLACFGGHHSNGPLFYFRNLSLFAPIKSFFRLLRNPGKKSTADQTGAARDSLLSRGTTRESQPGSRPFGTRRAELAASPTIQTTATFGSDIVARVGLIDRRIQEAASPLHALLYACHHRLANSYLLRCMSCPHHELGGDTMSMARLRGQGR